MIFGFYFCNDYIENNIVLSYVFEDFFLSKRSELCWFSVLVIYYIYILILIECLLSLCVIVLFICWEICKIKSIFKI